MEGWPGNINNIPELVKEYWKVCDQLHAAESLIFVGEKLVAPVAMKNVVLQAIMKVTWELRSVSTEVDYVHTGLL